MTGGGGSNSYDGNGNRTTTGYTTGTDNRLTNDGTYGYTYDNEGNMASKGNSHQTTSYSWDYRNRLTEVLVKNSMGATAQDDKFTYDVEGRRLGKSTYSGSQTWTVYNGANPYADFNSSGSLTERYLHGQAIDQLFARYDGSNASWYLTDLLGSVRMITDKSANVLDQITYDSYGNIVSETSPSNGDRFKFTGREWDSEIGLYYYRARYYNPAIGRFINDDPSGFAAGDANLYRYVNNNPTTSSDPEGKAPPSQRDMLADMILAQCKRIKKTLDNTTQTVRDLEKTLDGLKPGTQQYMKVLSQYLTQVAKQVQETNQYVACLSLWDNVVRGNPFFVPPIPGIPFLPVPNILPPPPVKMGPPMKPKGAKES